jgi:hypothetical protein
MMSIAYVITENMGCNEGCCNGEMRLLYVTNTKQAAESYIAEIRAQEAVVKRAEEEWMIERDRIAEENPRPTEPVRTAERYVDNQGRDRNQVEYEAWYESCYKPWNNKITVLLREQVKRIAEKYGLSGYEGENATAILCFPRWLDIQEVPSDDPIVYRRGCSGVI